MIPLLVHIQANLDGDLGLAAISRRARLSPFHLQRRFKAAVGETPKAYTSRLRLERAAFQLLVHDAKVIEVALECGYRSHETFTRAFRRRFGRSPSEYRELQRKAARRPEGGAPAETLDLSGQRYELSATRVVRLRPQHLAFRRHVGPYESVPETLFDELERWARRRRLAGPRVFLGIGHDAPITTPPERLRFDAALVVPGPFERAGRIGYQLFPGGLHAVTTHAGPDDTLPLAYAAIFPRVTALRGYRLVGLPAVEIYHSARVNARYALEHTDICLPVTPTR